MYTCDYIEYKGGRCERCGYDKYREVLEFHRRDHDAKLKGVARLLNRRWSVIQTELDKCDLLCANCHREVEVEKKQDMYRVVDMNVIY